MIETVETHQRFQPLLKALYDNMLQASEVVNVGEWQGQVSEGPRSRTRELMNVSFAYDMRLTVHELQRDVRPNLPWADEHFDERVSGIAHNPPPSSANWPFRDRGHEEHLLSGKFSHTYPERFWPKYANGRKGEVAGIRFNYGDLSDVIKLLQHRPLTRQAYLPIWFPEDTGAVGGQRVPCTLGYHFIQRLGHSGARQLHVTYFMRSCDLYRHFKDDVYLAARLGQHVASAVGAVPGQLVMHITSLHVFESDLPIIKTLRNRLDDE